ncbi:MAG: hypothetical protein AAGJ82_04295 [Bacteroidota bacterium]
MRQLKFLSFALLFLIFCGSCQIDGSGPRAARLTDITFSEVRLQDGVPLTLRLSVYWQGVQTAEQTARPDTVLHQLLLARGVEIVREVSNRFTSADSVFSLQRDVYILAIKDELQTSLPEADLAIHDVIVRNVQFPVSFTQALEEIGLQEIKEEQIRKQNELALAQAAANEKKAVADGQVAVAQAEADGRLQAIRARTEANRRKSEMARAETEAAVSRTKASAEADRLRKLKAVEVEKQREIEMIAVEKQREMDKVALEQQLELARLCESNPTYASFLVNRELAGNVEIAVLPTGSDANVFGGLLNSRLPGKKND